MKKKTIKRSNKLVWLIFLFIILIFGCFLIFSKLKESVLIKENKNITTINSEGNKQEGITEDDLDEYNGKLSSVIPYKGLKFKDIDIYKMNKIAGELKVGDFENDKNVFDGYTFVANKGDDFEFLAEEDFTSNPGSFIKTELYGWGPTIIKMNTRIGWQSPATTRYFYVVIGENFYGSNTSSYNDRKYGRYMFKITKRN